jgi:hypothetical protein
MRTVASHALALALLGTLAGCGKSSMPTAPVTGSSSGPKTQSEARQVAQQSAVMGSTYFEQAKSLLAVATGHSARPARVRPYGALGTATDSTSLAWALQGYDINGNPIDWLTQRDQLASLKMDFRWYYKTNGDSLMIDSDLRSHSNVAGLEAAATRYVANATDTSFAAYNGYSAGYHMIYHSAGTSTTTNLTWEKSGTPAYPVAGTITQHWHMTYEYWYGAQHVTGDITTDATITFNGTRYASLQAGTYTFSLDLDTWTVS